MLSVPTSATRGERQLSSWAKCSGYWRMWMPTSRYAGGRDSGGGGARGGRGPGGGAGGAGERVEAGGGGVVKGGRGRAAGKRKYSCGGGREGVYMRTSMWRGGGMACLCARFDMRLQPACATACSCDGQSSPCMPLITPSPCMAHHALSTLSLPHKSTLLMQGAHSVMNLMHDSPSMTRAGHALHARYLYLTSHDSCYLTSHDSCMVCIL